MSVAFSSEEYLNLVKKDYGVRGYDHAKPPEGELAVVLKYVKLLNVGPKDRFLDVGCGFGRVLREINDLYKILPYGLDISPRVIAGARQRGVRFCAELRNSPAERIDFPENCIDKILCWGTFEHTEQERSLFEMARVSRKGGLLLLAGKNDTYHEDDRDALRFERDARKKTIPLTFTIFSALSRMARELELKIADQFFFERSGDVLKDVPLKQPPARFYEYVLVIENQMPGSNPLRPLERICVKTSKPFAKLGEF
jgi:SAM-dependent methyltransferase